MLQRATLAEKEVSTLKEQLAAANDGNIKTEGQQSPQNLLAIEPAYDTSNPRRTPNSNADQELQAKDKEVILHILISSSFKNKFVHNFYIKQKII